MESMALRVILAASPHPSTTTLIHPHRSKFPALKIRSHFDIPSTALPLIATSTFRFKMQLKWFMPRQLKGVFCPFSKKHKLQVSTCALRLRGAVFFSLSEVEARERKKNGKMSKIYRRGKREAEIWRRQARYILISVYHHVSSPFLTHNRELLCSPRPFSKYVPSCLSPSKCVPCIASVCLLALGPIANARDIASFQANYACEDVQSYYAAADHLEGDALSKELNSIVSPHHSLSYKEVWDALKILDAAEVDHPEASPDIVEIYSARAVPKRLAGKSEGWNREHLWPRSYGLTRAPSLTDLHNIHPADVNVNSSRGNKYFGECHVGSTSCKRPAIREAAPDTETDVQTWAPPWQVRGDIARALIYMAVRYGFYQPGEGEGPVLHLSDSPNRARREMGVLSVLLRWNELDPPSRGEKLMNERICRLYQQNRNPFVDHPEFANRIWERDISSHQHQSRQMRMSPSPSSNHQVGVVPDDKKRCLRVV